MHAQSKEKDIDWYTKEEEFEKIGIEVEGLKVEIDNMEEVKKRKEIMYEGLVKSSCDTCCLLCWYKSN
jgi:hypothetical protein